MAQVPGGQEEEHRCVGELRPCDTSIDQEQREETQCPRKEADTPLLNKRPVLVTDSKAETSNYQDVALGMNLFTNSRTKTNVIRIPSTVPEE